jgi:hypothetical protein
MQRSALDAEVRRSVNEKLEKSGEKERHVGYPNMYFFYVLSPKSHISESPNQVKGASSTETCRKWLARPT